MEEYGFSTFICNIYRKPLTAKNLPNFTSNIDWIWANYLISIPPEIIEVNQFAQIRLILENKFDNNNKKRI